MDTNIFQWVAEVFPLTISCPIKWQDARAVHWEIWELAFVCFQAKKKDNANQPIIIWLDWDEHYCKWNSVHAYNPELKSENREIDKLHNKNAFLVFFPVLNRLCLKIKSLQWIDPLI